MPQLHPSLKLLPPLLLPWRHMSQVFELEEKDPNAPAAPTEEGAEGEGPKPIIVQVRCPARHATAALVLLVTLIRPLPMMMLHLQGQGNDDTEGTAHHVPSPSVSAVVCAAGRAASAGAAVPQ